MSCGPLPTDYSPENCGEFRVNYNNVVSIEEDENGNLEYWQRINNTFRFKMNGGDVVDFSIKSDLVDKFEKWLVPGKKYHFV